MAGEEFGMKLDNVSRLRLEADHIGTASEGLQLRLPARLGPQRIHHLEGIFVAVEVQGLKAGAAADLEMPNAGVNRGLEGGQDVRRQNPGAEEGLKAVTEGRDHGVCVAFHVLLPPLGLRPVRARSAWKAATAAATLSRSNTAPSGEGGTSTGCARLSPSFCGRPWGSRATKTRSAAIARTSTPKNANTASIPTRVSVRPSSMERRYYQSFGIGTNAGPTTFATVGAPPGRRHPSGVPRKVSAFGVAAFGPRMRGGLCRHRSCLRGPSAESGD